ncbi:MAG: hypothetical protein AAGD06_15645 [Acidobacteriota bacterium]
MSLHHFHELVHTKKPTDPLMAALTRLADPEEPAFSDKDRGPWWTPWH